MKELSIEQKAQRYDEALERMKSWVRGEHPECFTEAKKAAEFIFPELKESGDEDEKIRNTLIDYFKDYKTQEEMGIKTFFGIPTDNILAWLEKQGEQKPAWSEEDNMMIEETLYFLREYQHSNRCKDENGMQNSVTCEEWLKSLTQRIGG